MNPCPTLGHLTTVLVVSFALLTHTTTYGGVLAAGQKFDESELAAFQQLETLSQPQTQSVQGGDGLMSSIATLLIIAAVVGLAVWAASEYEASQHECVIDGVKIDSNSKECKDAADRAAFEASLDDDDFF